MDMGEFFLPSREQSYVVMSEESGSYVVMSEESGKPYYVGSRPRVVELLVPMCCIKCEEKVRETMLELEGVQGLVVDPTSQRVTVTGFVDPLRTLRKARRVKKDAQLLSGHQLVPSKHYRTSEYRPSATSARLVQSTSTYHTSLYSHGSPHSYGYHHEIRPSYDEMVVTSPYYVEHIQTPSEYWY